MPLHPVFPCWLTATIDIGAKNNTRLYLHLLALTQVTIAYLV
ncbi:MAG: hypothetical protein ACFWUC_06670 [Oscillospiraceae bacterium]